METLPSGGDPDTGSREWTGPPDRVAAVLVGVLSLVAAAGGASVALWLLGVVPPGPTRLGRHGAVVVGSVVVLVAGGGLGLVGRRHSARAVGGIVLLGIAAAALRSVAGTGLVAPVVGVVVGVAAHRLLYRAARRRSVNLPPDAAAAGHRTGGRTEVSRRRVLVVGGTAALGVGAAGLIASLAADGSGSSGVPSSGGHGAAGDPLLRGRVIDVRDFGVRADGVTDDGPAIVRALAAANDVAGTLYLPAASYFMRVQDALEPARGVTIAGDPGRTIIRLDTSAPERYREFCAAAGSDVTIDGLMIERVSDFPVVLFPVGPAEHLTLSRLILVGHQDRFRRNYCHGIQLGVRDGEQTSGLRLVRSSLDTMSYGLFQTSASTGVTTDIRVTECTFTRGGNTDLEFNSPKGATRDLTVERCTFADNVSAGFGVGLAFVARAAVRGNTFTNCSLEGVHIEDYCEDMEVEGNTFTACGLRANSHVQIIGGSRGVRTTGNTFGAAMNVNPIFCVNVLPGGTAPTGGGRAPLPPSDIVVQDNDFDCAPAVGAVYLEGVVAGTINGNRLRGPGVEAIPGESAPERAFTLLASPATRVGDNVIAGVRY